MCRTSGRIAGGALLDSTAVVTPETASSILGTLDNPTRLSECFELLDRAYANRQTFADGSRRLAEEGWMIARVSERHEQQSIIARILGTPETHFDVTYERLVRHVADEAPES
jgi:hypothetical protein